MSIPEKVGEILYEIGQVAAEVPCMFDGYREFVSVCVADTDRDWGYQNRYPYLGKSAKLYRVRRFRVTLDKVENDKNICEEDLVDSQNIVVASEADVEYVMGIWKIPMKNLLSPREVDIPL